MALFFNIYLLTNPHIIHVSLLYMGNKKHAKPYVVDNFQPVQLKKISTPAFFSFFLQKPRPNKRIKIPLYGSPAYSGAKRASDIPNAA